jgi:hypothetical protein
VAIDQPKSKGQVGTDCLDGGHILASTDLIKERYAAVVKFILDNY